MKFKLEELILIMKLLKNALTTEEKDIEYYNQKIQEEKEKEKENPEKNPDYYWNETYQKHEKNLEIIKNLIKKIENHNI